MKTKALALMIATSSCAGVRHKRYSGQQEIAPRNLHINTRAPINQHVMCFTSILDIKKTPFI
jgi:hypothetical protein